MVTVHDVAQAAGVSISTVSRALAAPDRVAPATRDRVVAAAERLGYHVNRAASGLRAGRTGALGLLVPDLENPFFASVTKGVQERARRAGYAVFVVDSNEDPAQERELLVSLGAQTDGILLCSPRISDDEVRAAAQRSRVVLVNRRLDELPAIDVDIADGALRAIEHLRALGHRRIAYVGGPVTSWSDSRRRAGLQAARERFPELDIVELGAFRPRMTGGTAAADLVVASGATAALTHNDLMAIGLLERLRSRGLDVPGDLSVVGFDDTFVATLGTPALSTVRVDTRAMGAAAVDLFVNLSGPDRADHPAGLHLPVELVVRGSTGLAPSTHGRGADHDHG